MVTVRDTVQDLLNIVQKNKDKDKGWIAALVVGIIVVILTGIYGFVAWRQGKKLAKLRHERDVLEEAARRDKLEADLSDQQDVIDAAQERIEGSERKLQALAVERAQIEEAHIEAIRRIDEITTWDDVDRYMDGSDK